MSKEIIQFDQAMFESKLDAMVREKVTELLNAMSDASGGRDRQRREIRAFRRTEGVPGRPLRPEPDRQGRQARVEGAQTQGRGLRVRVVPEKLRTLDHGRPWSDDQFASTRLSSNRDMSR